jgi:hypothetical protein
MSFINSFITKILADGLTKGLDGIINSFIAKVSVLGVYFPLLLVDEFVHGVFANGDEGRALAWEREQEVSRAARIRGFVGIKDEKMKWAVSAHGLVQSESNQTGLR